MAVDHGSSEGQYVVFELNGESYGIEIERVQEIDRVAAVTRMPEAPAFVEGVINLRGRITPVVNLRARFKLPEAEETPRTRIVVVKAGESWVGLVVDGVSEVLRLPALTVEPPPDMATTRESAFVRGIAKFQERLVILLDLERVLDTAFQMEVAMVA